MELQETNKNQSFQISKEVQEVGKAIYHVNQLTPFRIDDDMLIEWSRSILEIIPNIDANDIKSLITDFKIGDIQYDNKKGIQNIFMGLKNKFGSKYFVMKPVL